MQKKVPQAEINSIKNQLIDKFKPAKIFLFGSSATGRFGKNSDLDFLIIKDDDRRPIEIEQELHKIIDYTLASDFIFLSTHEFQKRQKGGDFFIKEILTNGKILYG